MVERDIGQMIANAQCRPPARLHKLRRVQLVWRQDNNQPIKRIRLECVSFLMNTVTILIHPLVWLVKTYLCQRETTEQIPLTPTASAPVDTKDTATFDRVQNPCTERCVVVFLSCFVFDMGWRQQYKLRGWSSMQKSMHGEM